MTRREAREQAFLLIFEKSFRSEIMEDIIADAVEARQIEYDEFSFLVANGVCEHMERIDAGILQNSHKWEIKRISKVALALLRIALFEIIYMEKIPNSVSVNEAVELAKKYGGDEDSAFVNGLLGAYLRGENVKANDAEKMDENYLFVENAEPNDDKEITENLSIENTKPDNNEKIAESSLAEDANTDNNEKTAKNSSKGNDSV